jgi:hypothetical protein
VRIITGSLNSGYGHEFEKAFLKFEEELKDRSTHHRIIEYEIGGMKWVVRYEADGINKKTRGLWPLEPLGRIRKSLLQSKDYHWSSSLGLRG